MNRSQGKSNSSAATRWGKRPPIPINTRSLLLLSFALILLLLLFRSSSTFRSLGPARSLESHFRQCGGGSAAAMGGERFLLYAPHSGFSNQLAEFKNAVILAAILNRTVVVPPVLDHHAVVLGSCPKFRVAAASELRASVWDHSMQLAESRRYISMADIIDLSSVLSTSLVRTIDFRVFASIWCGLNVNAACFGGSLLSENLYQCRSLLSGMEGNVKNCIYAVEEDCRTTVWTYKRNDDGIPDSFQPDKELRRKKKISYVRRRRDVYKALGPGTEAGMATILAFGSLFTAPYKGSESHIDIHEVPEDPRIQSLLQRIEFIPFVSEIMNAGKDYAANKIKEPFLCAQLRLLDGQFKNHWKATFTAVKQKIEELQYDQKNNKAVGPINIFLMTDLPSVNWTGTYLEDLARDADSFRLHTLLEGHAFVLQTAKNVMAAQHGLGSGVYSERLVEEGERCNQTLSDILLFLEETICSCASLGFVGTSGSTIADSIELMRKNNICVSSNPS